MPSATKFNTLNHSISMNGKENTQIWQKKSRKIIEVINNTLFTQRKKVVFRNWKLIHLISLNHKIRQFSWNPCIVLLTPFVYTGYIRLLLNLYSMLVSHLHIQIKSSRKRWMNTSQVFVFIQSTSVFTFNGILSEWVFMRWSTNHVSDV